MLNKIIINNKKVPFVFLFVLIATFGLLIPKLGFYWDDWPVMFMTETQGTAGFWDFYQYDRPFSAWTYIVTTPILGTNPIGWHIFTLLLRWLTVFFLWLTLRKIWPDKSRQVFWVALLFSVYPLFDQQSVAVAYSQHWTCYLFYFVSVYLMLLAQEKRRFYYPLVLSAVFFSMIQMFTMEYFLGLELSRPIILWVYFFNREKNSDKKATFKKTTLSGWPFVILLIVYVIWRVFFLNLAGSDPNEPVLLKQLTESPVQALLALTQTALQDTITFFSSWATAIKPANIELQRPFFIASTGVAMISAGAVWLALKRFKPSDTQNEPKNWHRQAILFGIASALLATLPVWMIGRQVSLGLYGSRFGLAATFGLSVATVGVLEWLSNRDTAKNIVVCILIGISIHFHLYTAKDYQDSWEKQQRVFWQLHWRAPHILSETAIISDGEIFRFVGNYSTSMGIALLYPPTENPRQMDYWFFDIVRGNLYTKIDQLNSGVDLKGGLRNYSFEGSSKNVLVLYLPAENECARILTADDASDRDIPKLLQPATHLSNLNRIKPKVEQGWLPPKTIFGKEPDHTWCYFYEKSELARQYKNWDEVFALMDNAKKQGFSPSNVKEYIPWLDSYLHTDQIEKAYKLTRQMKSLSDRIDDQICRTWLQASDDVPSDTLDVTYQSIKEELACFD